MKKRIIFIFVTILIMVTIVGCSSNEILDIDDESIKVFVVNKEEDADNNGKSYVDGEVAEKLTLIDFYEVLGTFSRNVMQEEVEVMEMFALERSSFLRVAQNDLEREVYAYNYTSDDFTYLYYFDGELLSKTIINVGTGNVVKDDEGYAGLLASDAKELKEYFYSLIKLADISISDLGK